MDEFARYLLALHLAFAMPDAPPAIFTQPGVPSPSAPGAVHAAPTPNPATPAVIHAPPMAGGDNLVVTGGGHPLVNGFYATQGTVNGKPYYLNPETGVEIRWRIAPSPQRWEFFSASYALYVSTQNVASPELVATWEAVFGSEPVPVVSSGLTVPPAIHSPPGHTPGTPGAIHSAPARTPGNPPVITP